MYLIYEHLIVANTYLKSVTPVVAEEWAADKENVDYFPSFETVMNSKREAAWADDLRHLKDEIVQAIMRLLKDNYVKS